MFSNPLIIMSLTGSAVFLLYLLAYPLEKKYFSLKWRYRLLKIAAVFYLLPLPWFKYQIIEAVSFFFPKFREWGNPVEIINMKYSYSINPDLIQFTRWLWCVFHWRSCSDRPSDTGNGRRQPHPVWKNRRSGNRRFLQI